MENMASVTDIFLHASPPKTHWHSVRLRGTSTGSKGRQRWSILCSVFTQPGVTSSSRANRTLTELRINRPAIQRCSWFMKLLWLCHLIVASPLHHQVLYLLIFADRFGFRGLKLLFVATHEASVAHPPSVVPIDITTGVCNRVDQRVSRQQQYCTYNDRTSICMYVPMWKTFSRKTAYTLSRLEHTLRTAVVIS